MTEPAFYQIKNWAQFQHYKDRAPAWIKLHFEILASDDWVMLADASRLLAVVCMLVASRNDGKVPNKPAYLKRVAYLDHTPDLAPLISCGFLLDPLAAASILQALDTERLSREEESREERTEPNGSVSESGSDAPPPKRKRNDYSPEFEAAWLAYPTDPNMSKAKAYSAWKRLAEEDRAKVAASIPAFNAFCRKDPTYRPVHMVRFISERRFDGFLGDGRAKMATVDDWQKRLVFGRTNKRWSAAEWGPPPGVSGCMVPRDLIEPGDGVGWTQWSKSSPSTKQAAGG